MIEKNKSCVAIRHLQFEDLGIFADPILEAGYEIQYIDVPVESLSDAKDADLLFILGGPCGVYEDHLYPYIKEEIALAKERIEKELPTVGICLGAQIIASAAGAEVYAGTNGKEIGWAPISLTEEGLSGPLAPLANGGAPMFHWHGDTFDLPKGATLLGSSELYENQIYAIGDHILGFQSHPELVPLKIEHWLIGHACELSQVPNVNLLNIREETKKLGDALKRNGTEAMTNWLGSLN